MSTGRASIAQSIEGQRKVMNGCEVMAVSGLGPGLRGAWSRRSSSIRRSCRRPDVAGAAPACATPVGQAAALFLQLGEAQDGVDQVVVGGQLERVHPGTGERLAQGLFTPF